MSRNSMSNENSPATCSTSPARNPIPGPAEIAAQTAGIAAPAVAPAVSGSIPLRPPVQPPSRQHPLTDDVTTFRQEWREITPAIARELLEHWNVGNQSLTDHVWRRYAIDMKEGKFNTKNTQAIGFYSDGRLHNGQHRARAIVEADMSQRFLVWFGLNEDAGDTIDQNKRRTPAQALARRGFAHAITIERAVRLLWAYDKDPDSIRYNTQTIRFHCQCTAAQNLEYSEEYEEELKAAAAAVSSKPYKISKTKRWFSSGNLCFLWVLFSREEPNLAKRFFYQLATGLKSPLETAGLGEKDPVYWLREKLSDDTLGVHHRLGLTLKTWMALRDGKIIGERNLQKPSDKEKFPRIATRVSSNSILEPHASLFT